MVGIWADNGDGSLEFMAIVLLVLLAVLIGMFLPNRRKVQKRS